MNDFLSLRLSVFPGIFFSPVKRNCQWTGSGDGRLSISVCSTFFIFLCRVLFFLLALGFLSPISGWADTTVVTTIAQFYALDRETSMSGQEVRIQGVVTYSDEEWNLIYLQDATMGLTLSPQKLTSYPKPGDRVEVTGKTAFENQANVVVNPQFRILAQNEMPLPMSVEESDLLSPQASAMRVEVTGNIRLAMFADNRVKLDILKGKVRLACWVLETPTDLDLDSLVGTRVKVQGTCAIRYKDGKIDGAALFIPDMASIRVISYPTVPLTEMPVMSIQSLIEKPVPSVEAPRVRIQGVVAESQGAFFVLRDPTGSIEVRTFSTHPRTLDDRLDVWAFPAIIDQRIVLEDGVYNSILGEKPAVEAKKEVSPGPDVTLQSVRDIRMLSNAQASRSNPVELDGVVTYADSAWQHFFLQDMTGAVYVQGWLDGLKTGDRVGLQGFTNTGDVVPIVTSVTAHLIGSGKLPEPLRLGLKELYSTYYDCAWVELDGVVRGVDDAPSHAILHVLNPNGKFDVSIPDPNAGAPFHNLINARVRFRGVSSTQLNKLDQVLGLKLHVPDKDCIQILSPAPADPYNEAVRPIGSVSKGNLEILGMQRLHVRGVVTLVAPGQQFCLQDASGGIWINTSPQEVFQMGQTLDVVGFPVADGLSIRLEDAILRSVKESERIEPKPALASDILSEGLYDRELVTMEGRLLNDTGGTAAPTLIVQGRAGTFEAHFETGNKMIQLPLWKGDSLVRLTGVCSIQMNERGEPKSFLLLLRSADDVEVLQKPPWWTPRYAIAFGCGLLALILMAVGWVILLQRKVREHTEQIRQRIEAETAVGRRFSLVWENSVDGMRLTDAEGEIIQINPAYCQLVQKTREELEGQNLVVVYPEMERNRISEMYRDEFLRRAIPPRQEVETRYWNGNNLWLEQTNTFFEQPGQPLLLFSQFRDITDRKRAEEAVRTQIVALTRPLDDPAGIQFGDLFNIEEIQSIQDSFANATGVASIITQPDGTPITHPSNFCSLCIDVIRKTGKGLANCYKSDATLGRCNPGGPIVSPCLSGGLWDAGASIMVGGKHIANWLIGQVRDTTQNEEQMLRYADEIGADREEFRRALAKVPVMSRDQFAQVANMLFSFANELSLKAYQNIQQARFITERNHAEEEKEHLQAQLLQAQKMEAVGRLAGGVAHDFNNLLAVILGYGELIETGLPENSPWREEILQITSAALRAKDLTRQLLAFSRKQVLEMKPVDLNLLVESMEKMLRRLLGEDIELLVILAPSLGRVKADTTQLQQVLLNLCVNARDAMPGGGVLTIETQAISFDAENQAHPAALLACPYVLLSVSDTGHGMDAETQRQIFDPFFTTKEVGKGTGLGLATVYGIMKQHGGEILVESAPERGTVFKLYLPEIKSDRKEMAGSVEEGARAGQGEVILVVEDEQIVRELACRMLKSMGYEVIEVPDPELCLEIARSSKQIDLLLTDVIMPGLNGRQVYEQVKSVRPDIKVVFMSGYTDDVIADHGILDERVRLINKPFKASDLNKKIQEALKA